MQELVGVVLASSLRMQKLVVGLQKPVGLLLASSLRMQKLVGCLLEFDGFLLESSELLLATSIRKESHDLRLENLDVGVE